MTETTRHRQGIDRRARPLGSTVSMPALNTIVLSLLVAHAAAFIAPISGPAPPALRRDVSAPTLYSASPINNRVAVHVSMKKQEEEWVRPGVFDPANLGPWAILIVVLLFEGINLASRLGVPLPSFIQALIPLVLGCQYDGSCGS